MFMKTLIDSYIIPILNSPDKDFAPLAAAILRVACFYGVGVLSTLDVYKRQEQHIWQLVLKNCMQF